MCYSAALSYPIYRYLASPAEMASSATAITEVTCFGGKEAGSDRNEMIESETICLAREAGERRADISSEL